MSPARASVSGNASDEALPLLLTLSSLLSQLAVQVRTQESNSGLVP
jgi:hypothetical protein